MPYMNRIHHQTIKLLRIYLCVASLRCGRIVVILQMQKDRKLKRLSVVIALIGKVKDQFIPKQFVPPLFPSRDKIVLTTSCCDCKHS